MSYEYRMKRQVIPPVPSIITAVEEGKTTTDCADSGSLKKEEIQVLLVVNREAKTYRLTCNFASPISKNGTSDMNGVKGTGFEWNINVNIPTIY